MKKKITSNNPKDILAGRKVALGLLPGAGKIYGALAMNEGIKKGYGPYNWRENAVKHTVYLDATERHLQAIRDGQWLDLESGVPHWGHIIASASIVLDANSIGKLIDDLPPPGKAAEILDKYEVKK
ncbi:hypothetical protein LCGC14_2702110 [marine sediment metagenome]|uniref:dATP/dGTP diphosphohydrolase N-terminal domain-containing protein n=2 Tax=marine sediment metagenome TaxID=412755 RepID=A0A0F8ZFJ4_9ZZZZ